MDPTPVRPIPATHIRHADAPRFEVAGAQVIAYASPSRGSGTLSMWRVSLAPGHKSPVHSLDTDEVFLCLSGAATFECAGLRTTVRAGDGFTAPAHTDFQFATEGTEPFDAVACVRAGAMARIERGEPFSPPWAK
ncbi:MAG: cupin domain-containing protein [Deltaproteobacteria bacterium]|nr:cupin domain-containing protein [Deltaproteobacteria bacterium]